MFKLDVINLTAESHEVRLNNDRVTIDPSGMIAAIEYKTITIGGDLELNLIEMIGLPNKKRLTVYLVNDDIKEHVGHDRLDIISVKNLTRDIGIYISITKEKQTNYTAKDVKFVNLTKHPVNEILGNNMIEPSGIEARVTMDTYTIANYGGSPIIYSDVDSVIKNLPEPSPGVVYIVSSLVAAHVKDRPDVVVPGNKINGLKGGQISGCKCLRATTNKKLKGII